MRPIAPPPAASSRRGWNLVTFVVRRRDLGAARLRRPAKAIDRYSSWAMVSGVDPSALRAAREQAGLTQHELAVVVGAAGGERISRWELGTSVPRPDFLVKLAKALDIPALRLIRFDGDVADLKALRLKAGLSASAVAAAANVAVPTYYAWEQGRWTVRPGTASLAPMAHLLGESVEVVTAAFDEAQRQRKPSEG
ncbi:helix-turn-helix domain-containing protein [Pimelobacter simplex]|uniref:helix-turn-helix domain-containing protein n=1 Tax=Nocardioides simplex TaxID=2045 RepID=UPI001934B61A|nr:helix-turn-helix transcriptional regulator [Pimelobacter simplex]